MPRVGSTATPPRRGFARFGVFELDLNTGELRKAGARVRLQEQPYLVLTTLLGKPGSVVPRGTLRKRLWPKGTFVDFEHGLNAAVKRLRTALGDTADNPRFVETLPRRGYRFIAPVTGDPVPPLPGAETDRIRVAVLPFENVSSDPDQEFFSDGLTEETIAQLGRIGSKTLGVIARTSAARFKRSGRTVDEIAQELGVSVVVEGSVRHRNERVRITARLVDAREQTNLWSDTYDGDHADWLSLQADVAGRIAKAVAGQLAVPA